MRAKPKPLTRVDRADLLLEQLYTQILEALKAADRPGTHIPKTNRLKFAAARLYASLHRTARFLGHVDPPRFMRYR